MSNNQGIPGNRPTSSVERHANLVKDVAREATLGVHRFALVDLRLLLRAELDCERRTVLAAQGNSDFK